jgi:hypothetical protein
MLVNTRLDETSAKHILSYRSRNDDPPNRIRRLLGMAKERLSDETNAKLTRFLEAGDPDGEELDDEICVQQRQ